VTSQASEAAEHALRRPKVLLVDDDSRQLKLSRLQLEAAGYQVETARCADAALEKVQDDVPDAILSDVFMGEVDGFGLCRRVRQDPRLARVPVILLSAHCHEERDRELAARVGASDLVMRTPDFKSELRALLATLTGTVSPAEAPSAELYEQLLRRNGEHITKLLDQAESAESRYRILFEHANDAITLLTPEGVVLEANQRWRTLLGIEPADMIGKHISTFAADGSSAAHTSEYQRSVASGGERTSAVALRRADGGVLLMEFSLSSVEIAGEPLVFSIGRDVTVEVLGRRALAAAEERYRTLLERIPDVIWTGTPLRQIQFATPNIQRVLGYTLEELSAQSAEQRTENVHPEDRTAVLAATRALAEEGRPFDLEYRFRHKDGRYIWLRSRSTAIYDHDGVRLVEGMLSDVTERKVLEESLQQAQKMEAIGQLTGGIAHDFNNILAAILANSHFLLEATDETDPRHADANEIREAAERAAALTRQLLAFSRRQVLEPAIVDLNGTVAGVEKMLCRLIGEDIALVVAPGSDLGNVRVDVGQLEQVIMNLAVNARDAMPTGGRLTIETGNVELDEECLGADAPVTPGRYVMLAVSDTGCGMDAETKRRIFEPFFTTKELGKGTGLGLSTCYGIVKQSGGHIWVYSERGKGSVFKIYLPRVDAPPDAARERPVHRRLEGSETILLVEDDDRVRSAVSRMLGARGYQLLVARDGAEARALVDAHHGAIHLLITDVVMPNESGPDVAQIVRERTQCKVLFMSGYTDHAVLRLGVLETGQSFIQKPFAPETLARKAREVLDG
jgi:two-component system, cell cycle sensor histidine kinase and response regulator CckA